MLAEPIRFKLWLISFKIHDDYYETFNNVRIETWRKSCLPIFQMPLSAKQSIHEHSGASLSYSLSFLVSSLSFYNFSLSFLKHGHGRQRKALSWSTSSPAERGGGIQTLVTVELNAWSNYCVITYDYLPAVFQLGMSNTPLLAYTR